jgi:hypothetical protein
MKFSTNLVDRFKYDQITILMNYLIYMYVLYTVYYSIKDIAQEFISYCNIFLLTI